MCTYDGKFLSEWDVFPIVNWQVLQIPECTSPISNNTSFRTEMCTFLFWMVHCGIWNRCILQWDWSTISWCPGGAIIATRNFDTWIFCLMSLPYWCQQTNVLTLYVIIFQREQKHIFTLYVIPPHWHETGGWNPSTSKIRTYLSCIVNITGADVARVSATMVFIMLNRINSVPAR